MSGNRRSQLSDRAHQVKHTSHPTGMKQEKSHPFHLETKLKFPVRITRTRLAVGTDNKICPDFQAS